MWRFVRSPFGLTLRGIRDSESRMRSLGYNVPLHLFIGFTVSGFFAGVAGGIYAFFNNFVSPSTVALAQSVEGLLMAIVGGVGTLFGAFVGAAAIITLENIVSSHTERWQTVLGLTFILIMILRARRACRESAHPVRARKRSKSIKSPEEKDRVMDRRQFLKTTGLTLAAAGIGVLPCSARSRRRARSRSACWHRSPASSPPAAARWWKAPSSTSIRSAIEIAGRKVELIVEDDASNPDTALQKARRLVEQANVDFLIGNLLANTGLAVANYVKGTGTPYFIPIIAADDLTQRQRIKNVVRVAGYSASAFTHPLGDWALKQGYKKIATVSQDYTFGHEQCGGLAQVFTEGGGEIVQQFWHPLNTADFSPYLGQIANLQVDAVFAMETGADATRFIQQYASFGLKGKIPLLGAMNATDQSVIRTLGEECEGIVSPAHFAEGSTTRLRRNSSTTTRRSIRRCRRSTASRCISGAMWVSKAIEKHGRQDRRPRRLHRYGAQDRPRRLAARHDRQARCLRQPDLRRLHPQGGEAAGREILERAGRDLRQRLAVLEIRSRDLPEAAALLAHLPGHQEELMGHRTEARV